MYCKLCLEERTLINSHIIPEFLYRPGYDEIHRIRVLSKVKDSYDQIQKGYREKLLCASCETKICSYEDYFAKLWYVQKSLPEVSDGTSFQLSGLDYTLFKLFHLSVLWRSSIPSLPPFSQVSLEGNEEYIRKMLLDQQPGSPDDYQIFGVLLRYPGSDQVLDGLIASPTLQIFNQRRLFMFVFGGCVWHYYEVFGNPDSVLEEISLSPEGTFTLRSKSLDEVDPLHRFFIKKYKDGK